MGSNVALRFRIHIHERLKCGGIERVKNNFSCSSRGVLVQMGLGGMAERKNITWPKDIPQLLARCSLAEDLNSSLLNDPDVRCLRLAFLENADVVLVKDDTPTSGKIEEVLQ